jgi:hypothetical protein
MADPLSLGASVLAIATAAVQISKAISRLRHFGEVPSQVYALKNEVTDLEVVLRQLSHALEQKPWALNTGQGPLESVLSQARSRLADLARALEQIAHTLDTGKTKITGRNALWWKWKTLFQTFQEDIRSIKTTLTVILGASNSCVVFPSPLTANTNLSTSHDLHHIMLELRRVSVLTSKSGESLNDHHLAQSSHMDQQYQVLNERLDVLGRLILNEKLQENSRSNSR